MDELFSWENSINYNKYTSQYLSGFKYREVKRGKEYSDEQLKYNCIIFLSSGSLGITVDKRLLVTLNTSECILLPRNSSLLIKTTTDSFVLIFYFEVLQNIPENLIVKGENSIFKDMVYESKPTAIRFPINNFVEQMIYYLKTGMDCNHLFEIKEKEFFILLRSYYDIEEIAYLLYPLFCKEPSFKDFILYNYRKVNSISELVRLSGMCRTNFENKFKQEFNTSPHKWMLQQTAKQILYKAAEPDVTINDLIQTFQFNSATHFNRFCKQYFNCTPGQLIKKHGLK